MAKRGRPKKPKPRQIEISEKEMNFVDLILRGVDLVTAYQTCWVNNYVGAKAKYEANRILNRERVQAYKQHCIVEREKNTEITDEAFVVDIFKHIAVKYKDSKPVAALRAAEDIAKAKGMFKETEQDDNNADQRKISQDMFDLREREESGEDISEELKKLERQEIEEEEQNDNVEFVTRDNDD